MSTVKPVSPGSALARVCKVPRSASGQYLLEKGIFFRTVYNGHHSNYSKYFPFSNKQLLLGLTKMPGAVMQKFLIITLRVDNSGSLPSFMYN